MSATIVIPLKAQRDDWLHQALASALGQTVPVTVLVVTSPQTPASNRQVLAELGASNPRLRALERPPGAGFAEAINLGVREATTERVGLLLSDDWLAPETVASCLVEDADIVSTGHTGFTADGERQLWRRALDQARYESLPSLEARASYLAHFFLFRRNTFLAVGGVDPDIGLTGADDYDLIWTLLEHGASVRVIPEPLYRCRDHDGERLTLRPQADQVRDLRRILAKHGVGPDEAERLVAQKAKWYGVPCQVAMADPQWYLGPGTPGSGPGDGP